MTFEAIVDLLEYAGGHDQLVRVTTEDRRTIVGVPTSVDRHPTALEVYLRPQGADDLEIAIRLTQILSVELEGNGVVPL